MSRVMKSNILINIYPSIFFNFILIIINKKNLFIHTNNNG